MANAYINYVEPNFSNNYNGVPMQTPLEDLCINVNLAVEIPSDLRGGKIQTENKKILLTWKSNTKEASINLMQGSKNEFFKTPILTTDYTNATYEDMLSNTSTSEMFGITSIDIQYDAYYTPQVTLQFSDVRGIALFGPEERRHPGQLGVIDDNIAGSFFKCFFIMPYPKFNLMVKGFYGQPVTYELTCSDFRAKFDPKTGNFTATAKLVGYQFSMLADVSLNTLMAVVNSPYGGAKYWDNQVDANRFVTEDGKPLKKLHELIDLWDEIKKITTKELAQTDEAQSLNNTQNKISSYTSLKNKYLELVNLMKAECPEGGLFTKNVTKDGKKYECKVQVVYEDDAKQYNFVWFTKKKLDQSQQIKTIWGEVVNELIGLFGAEGEEHKPKFNYSGDNVVTLRGEVTTLSGSWGVDEEVSYQNLINKINENGIKQNVKFCKSDNEFKKLFKTAKYAYDNGLIDFIDGKIKALEKEEEDNKRDIEKKQKKMIISKLSFTPNAYNIFKILLAHLETLIQEIYTCHQNIIDKGRTLGDMGIDIEGYESTEFIPPFPQVQGTEIDKETNAEVKVDKWIGDVVSKQDVADEISLINGLLEGVNEIGKTLSAVDTSDDSTSDEEGVMVPVIPMDYYTTEIWSNVDTNSFKSVCGAIVLRAMGAMGLYNEWGDSKAGAMGATDAKKWGAKFPELSKDIVAKLHGDSWTWESIINEAKAKNWYDAQPLINEEKDIFWDKYYLGLGGKLIPIRNIDTTENSNMLQEMYANDTLREESYVRVDVPKDLKGLNNYIYIDKDINKFISTYKTHPFLNNRIWCDVKECKEYIVNANLDASVFATKFKSSDETTLSYTPTAGSGLFGTSKEQTKGLGKDVFGEGKYGHWCENDLWTYAQIKTATGTLTRENYDIINAYSQEDYKSELQKYTIPMFRGLCLTEDGVSSSSPSRTLFTQPIYYSATTLEQKAYYFLKTFEKFKFPSVLTDVEAQGFDYEKILGIELLQENDGYQKGVRTMPYAVLLYLGACLHQGINDIVKVNLTEEAKSYFINEFKTWANGFFQNKIHNVYANPVLPKLYDKVAKNDSSESNAHTVFANNMDDKFFENYISFMTGDAGYGTTENGVFAGFRLCNRENNPNLDDVLLELCSPVALVLGGDFILSKNTHVRCEVTDDWMEKYLTSFIDTLKNIYKVPEVETENSPLVDNDASVDVKHSLYKYVKTVYDKWLAGNLYQTSNGCLWDHWKLENFFEPHFHFIDTFYNYTPQVLFNVELLINRMVQSYSQSEYTLIEFMSLICQDNNMMIQCVQNFLDYNNKELMDEMFTPFAYNEAKQPEPTEVYPDFVIVKQHEPSKHLDMDSVENKNTNDSYMSNAEDLEIPVPIRSKTNMKRPDYMHLSNEWKEKFGGDTNLVHKIPCFGVAYGQQYQSYFTDIDVGMENPITTEQSIKAQMNIINAQHMEGNKQEEGAENVKVQVGKQDLYSVYMNNSYTCNVTMLGCPWIQPLMHLCLLNIPMFRGTYLIQKVTHKISVGDMKTTFTGTRVAKNTSPIASDVEISSDNVAETSYLSPDVDKVENSAAAANNDCKYQIFYPENEYNGKGIDIEELKNTTVEAFESKLNGKWDKWFFNNYKTATVWDALVSGLYGEYGGGTDFDQQLVSTVLYNRIMKGGIYNKGLRQNVCTYMRINGFAFSNKNGHKDLNDRKTYGGGKQWQRCERNLEKIFTNSPSVLIGQTVTPKRGVGIYEKGNLTKQVSAAKVLTKEDLQKVYYYVNATWYEKPKENGGGHRQYDYLFHHSEHLFTTSSDIGACWSEKDIAQESSSGNTSSNNGDKLNKMITCIEKTCQSAPKLGITTVHKHQIEGKMNAMLITATEKQISNTKNSTLFDVVLNAYSDKIPVIKWVCENVNQSKAECYAVYVEIPDTNNGKNDIAVSYLNKGSYVAILDKISNTSANVQEALNYLSKTNTNAGTGLLIDKLVNNNSTYQFSILQTSANTQTNTEGDYSGLFNDQYYISLKKHFGEITDKNINEFKDVKNYTAANLYNTNNYLSVINKLLGKYNVEKCDKVSDADMVNLGSDTKLSKNYTLEDAIRSATASRDNIDNRPTPEHFNSLRKLFNEIVEPIREEYLRVQPEGALEISSVYRSAALNKAVKGSKTSQHLVGQAVDMHAVLGGKRDNFTLFDVIYEMIKDTTGKYKDFHVGQLIWEKGNSNAPQWIHVSLPYSKKDDIKQYVNKTYIELPKNIEEKLNGIKSTKI